MGLAMKSNFDLWKEELTFEDYVRINSKGYCRDCDAEVFCSSDRRVKNTTCRDTVKAYGKMPIEQQKASS